MATFAAAGETPPTSASPAKAATGTPGTAAPASETAPASSPAGPPQIRKVGPDAYYLRDAKGNLILVPDVSFEEFERLLQLDRKLAQPQQPPRFALQELDVTGTVTKGRASFDARFTVWLRDGDWVRAPLGLAGAVLREPVAYKGPGQLVIDFDETLGYVAWLRHTAGEKVSFTLPLLAEVKESSGQRQLALRPAKAATSRLKLTVDTPTALPTNGNVTSAPAGTGKTLLALAGLDERTTLEWRKAAEEGALPLYDVVSNVAVRIEGPARWSTEIRLRITSPTGPVAKFQVRLPPGAKLSPQTQQGVEIVPLPEAAGTPAGEGPLCEVRLARDTAQAEEVRIAAITELPADASADLTEVGGFAVLGAARHSGLLDLISEGDWYLRYAEGANLRQVDELPEAARRNHVFARFEFSRQPYSLRLRAQRRATLIGYEPTYVVLVGATSARLEARMRCQVRGGKAHVLELEMGDWKVDSGLLEPAGMFDENALDPTSSQPLALVLARPASGEFEFTVRASQALAAGQESLQLSLPRPRGSVVSPATVVVVPDNNVTLELQPEQMVGLASEASSPPAKLPPRTQNPLMLRETGEGGAPRLAALRRIHAREIQAKVETLVTVAASEVETVQRFSYQVAYEGIDRVRLLGTREAFANLSLTLEPEGTPLPFTPLVPEGSAPASDERLAVVALPPPARLGAVVLAARRKTSLEGLPGERRKVVDLPLLELLPEETGMAHEGSGSARVISLDPVYADLRAGGWNRQGEQGESPARQWLATSLAPQRWLPLVVNYPAAAETGTLVEMAWVQCQVLGNQRYDRAVFRLATTAPTVEIRLPDPIELASLEVLLDGQKAKFRSPAPGTLQVDLPTVFLPPSRVLELWYQVGMPAAGASSLVLPRVEKSRWTRRTWVQVALPPGQHLLDHQGEATSDLTWQWRGFFWEPQGRLNETQLERLCGATSQVELSSQMNRYVFSAFAPLAEFEFTTVARRSLVLWGGGLMLVLGCLWIYVPALRNAPLWPVWGLAVVAFAASFPTLALLAAQASVVGLALAALALALHALVVRRGERRHGLYGRWSASPSAVLGNRRPGERGDGSSATTTLAAPVAVALGTADTEP